MVMKRLPRARRNKPQFKSNFPASSYILLANIQLVKVSHMAKCRWNRWRDDVYLLIEKSHCKDACLEEFVTIFFFLQSNNIRLHKVEHSPVELLIKFSVTINNILFLWVISWGMNIAYHTGHLFVLAGILMELPPILICVVREKA